MFYFYLFCCAYSTVAGIQALNLNSGKTTKISSRSGNQDQATSGPYFDLSESNPVACPALSSCSIYHNPSSIRVSSSSASLPHQSPKGKGTKTFAAATRRLQQQSPWSHHPPLASPLRTNHQPMRASSTILKDAFVSTITRTLSSSIWEG